MKNSKGSPPRVRAASACARTRLNPLGLSAASLLLATVFAWCLVGPPQRVARAASTTVVISQVYGGGGNTGATYKNDFIELFNKGGAVVNLSGWSVQYTAATGTTWQVTNLSGVIQPGKYYLVQEGSGGGGTTSLPTPDATDNTNMNATAGKVALVSATGTLSGACPTANVVDFVGYGTSANCFEGAGPAPAPTPSSTNGDVRKGQGAQDTDNNSNDFTTGAANPRNSSSSATMTITFGASSKGCAFSPTGLPLDPSSGLTWNHTMSGGTSRVLIVGVSTFAQSGIPLVNGLPVNRVAAVTYNGVPLSRVNTNAAASPGTSPASAVEVFRLTDSAAGGLPAAGTSAAVVVRLSSAVNYAVGGAASFSGVNQATPTGAFASASGSDANPRVTVTSATNEVVIDTAATVYDITGGAAVTADPAQTERWNGKNDNCFPDTGGAISIGAGSTKSGSSSVQMSWTMPTAHDWAVGAVPLRPLSLTAVELAEFAAERDEGGVTLRWRTGYEADNLGFNVYRERGGRRTRVNAALLSGSALVVGQGTALSAGRSYQFTDPGGDWDALYWLEDVSLDGESSTHGPVSPVAADSSQRLAAADSAVPLSSLVKRRAAADSTHPAQAEWPASSANAHATACASSWSSTAVGGARLRQQWELAARPALKIGVRGEGWFRVGRAELVGAGLSAGVDARDLQLYADGLEVPMLVSAAGRRLGPNDYVEFYGVGLDTPATDTRVYWLVEGARPGLRVLTEPVPKPPPIVKAPPAGTTPGTPPPAKTPAVAPSFDLTVERRERVTYFPALLNGGEENFFGPPLTSSQTEEVLSVHHLVRSDAGRAVLEVVAQGLTGAAHQVEVFLGGVEVGRLNFDARAHAAARFSIPLALLSEGDNTLTLTAAGGQSDISLLDYLRLTYPHTYQADDDALRFAAPAGQTVRVGGFTGRDVRVLDITDVNAPREVPVAAEADGAGFAVSVPAGRQPSTQTRVLFAFTARRASRAAYLSANKPSDLHNGARHLADMVVVTHAALRASAERLAAARRGAGLLVEVVGVEDVYDEWSYGSHSAQALHDFLARAVGTWRRAPRFALLFGDASFDPRDYLGLGASDFVPTATVDTAAMETASDDALADFDGDSVADVCVGRLPVRTAAEADAVVSKLISYRPSGLQSLLLVNDRKGSDGYDFEAAARRLLAYRTAATSVQTITRGEDAALTRIQIVNALNAGPSVVNFYGHGAEDLWTSADLLPSRDAASLTNGGGLSLYVLMTCLNGYHHSAYRDSLAETLLKDARGGAFAVWASSGITSPTAQAAMSEEFYRQLFGGEGLTLGEAVRKAKAATPDRDARATWTLFGDPSTTLR